MAMLMMLQLTDIMYKHIVLWEKPGDRTCPISSPLSHLPPTFLSSVMQYISRLSLHYFANSSSPLSYLPHYYENQFG